MALDDPNFPPAPWTLNGDAIVGLKLVSAQRARRLVPANAKIICVWPKQTLATLFLARYRNSPVGEYRELIVAPALVWRKGRIGAWVSHIYVDNPTSLAAGREMWALPKQMASMRWSAERVSLNGSQLRLQAVIAPPSASIPLPFFGAAMSRYGLDERWFTARGLGSCGLARATVQLTGEPGLAALGLSGTMTVIVCKKMRITIGRPRR